MQKHFQDPKLTPSGKKVIRRRKREEEEEKKTMNSATSFAMQLVCNAARAAHALCSDQLSEMARTLIGKIRNLFGGYPPPHFISFFGGGVNILAGQHLLGVKGGREFRVLACADTGARTHRAVRQYFFLLSFFYMHVHLFG